MGQKSYDNAANMSGCYIFLTSICNLLCAEHSLNLVGVSAIASCNTVFFLKKNIICMDFWTTFLDQINAVNKFLQSETIELQIPVRF